jgi:hypothetical protein
LTVDRLNSLLALFGGVQEDDPFRRWYSDWASQLGLNPDPYDSARQYDWEAAWRAGAEPDNQGNWPTQFKLTTPPPPATEPPAAQTATQQSIASDRLKSLLDAFGGVPEEESPIPGVDWAGALESIQKPVPSELPPPAIPVEEEVEAARPAQPRSLAGTLVSALGRGISYGAQVAKAGIGEALQMGPESMFALYTPDMPMQATQPPKIRPREMGDRMAEEAYQRLQQMPPLKQFKDVDWNNPADFVEWVGNAVGQGLASTAPSLAGGIVGGVAAGPVGAFLGAAGPGFVLNMQEAREVLRQEGVPEEDVDRIAAMIGVPMAALDMIFPGSEAARMTTSAVRKGVARTLGRFVMRMFVKGATLEGVTEGLQNVVAQTGAAIATGQPIDIPEFVSQSVEDFMAGAVTGLVLGGAGGVIRPGVAPGPTVVERIQRLQALGQAFGLDREGAAQILQTQPLALETRQVLEQIYGLGEQAAAPVAQPVAPVMPVAEPVLPPVAPAAPAPTAPLVPEIPVPQPMPQTVLPQRQPAEEEVLGGTIERRREPEVIEQIGEQRAQWIEDLSRHFGVDLFAPETIFEVDPKAIAMDPERFQFKRLGPEGVSSELKEVTVWDPQAAGVISIWADPADNQLYVVNGHHRLELAQRLGVDRIRVQFIEAETAELARAAGAYMNIVEQRGTALDIAKFMRDMEATPQDLAAAGVSLRADLIRNATALSRLTPEIFNEIATERVPQKFGVAVGEMITDPQLQMEAFSRLRNTKYTAAQAREFARQFAAEETEMVTQEDLFGVREERRSLYEPKSLLADEIRRRLGRDRRLFGYVSTEERAQRLREAGETQIDVEAAREIASAAGQVQEVFDRLYTRSGPIADLMTAAARRVIGGEPVKTVVDSIYGDIGEAVRIEIAQARPTEEVGRPSAIPPEAAPAEAPAGLRGVVAGAPAAEINSLVAQIEERIARKADRAPEHTNLVAKLGNLVFPGIRQQDAADAGQWYLALQRGEITEEDWAEYKDQAIVEYRVSYKRGVNSDQMRAEAQARIDARLAAEAAPAAGEAEIRAMLKPSRPGQKIIKVKLSEAQQSTLEIQLNSYEFGMYNDPELDTGMLLLKEAFDGETISWPQDNKVTEPLSYALGHLADVLDEEAEREPDARAMNRAMSRSMAALDRKVFKNLIAAPAAEEEVVTAVEKPAAPKAAKRKAPKTVTVEEAMTMELDRAEVPMLEAVRDVLAKDTAEKQLSSEHEQLEQAQKSYRRWIDVMMELEKRAEARPVGDVSPRRREMVLQQRDMFTEAIVTSEGQTELEGFQEEIRREAPLLDDDVRETVARWRQKLSTPEEIARVRREGEEPGGATPLHLPLQLEAEMANSSGPFEQNAATVSLPAVEGAEAQERTLVPIQTPELVRLVVELLGPDRIFMGHWPARLRGRFYGYPAVPKGAEKIGLNPLLGMDYDQFAKTISHEIGHLIDYFPDLALDKGNLLGRIASLRNYLKHTIDREPTDPSRMLTGQDRRKIRRQAEKAIGPRPPKKEDTDALLIWQQDVRELYAEMIRDEIAERNLLTREQVYEELLLLSQWWRPYDPDAVSLSFKTYRESSEELYADAVSVLLLSPGTLQERAPNFFDSFIAYLGEKPEVDRAYGEIVDLTAKGPDAQYESRAEQRERGFRAGEDRIRESEERKDPRSFMMRMQQILWQKGAPAMKAERERVGKRTVPWSEKLAFKLALQELNHRANVDAVMIEEYSRQIYEPLQELGVSDDDMGHYLTLTRVAEGDRGGWAEAAKDVIMEITGLQSWAEARQAYWEMLQTGQDVDAGLWYLAHSGVLNPGGETPQTATSDLAAMKKKLSDDKFAKLEKIASDYRRLVAESFRAARDVGIISQEMWKQKIEPNIDTYATFAVVEYFNGRVPGGLKKQIGTVKDIANPLTTTLMKALAMNRLVERQKAVLAMIDAVTIDFPGAVSEEHKVDRYHREQAPGAGKENVFYYVDGKLRYRSMDKYLAAMLKTNNIDQLRTITQTLSSKLYGVFHPLYVVYSFAWQVRNPQRDMKRSYKSAMATLHADEPSYRQVMAAVLDPYIPIFGSPRQIKYYTKGWKTAWHRARRKYDPLLSEMLREKALSYRAFHSFEAAEGDPTPTRMMKKAGVLAPDGANSRRDLFGFVQKLSKGAKLGIETVSIFQETLSKVAMYKMLTDYGVTGQERAAIVRNYTGTPDSTTAGGFAGDITNGLFMYAKVQMAGLQADMEIATHPSTAAGYWARSVIVDFGAKAVMGMALAGMFGDDVKDWIKRIPSYDLEKYICVPIPPFYFSQGKDGTKKSVYLRLPHDDVTRMLAGTTWTLIRGLVDRRPHIVGQSLGVFYGEFPGFNPGIDLLVKAGQLAVGRNPFDAFRGREIVPRNNWEAGGWYRWKEYGRHFINEFGVLSQLGAAILPDFFYGSPEDSEPVPWETMFRRAVGISSLIKISDRGLNESFYWEQSYEEQQRARLKVKLDAKVSGRTSERNRLNRQAHAKPLEPKDEDRRQQLNTWYRVYYDPLLQYMEEVRDALQRPLLADEKRILNERMQTYRRMLNESIAEIPNLPLGRQAQRLRPVPP